MSSNYQNPSFLKKNFFEPQAVAQSCFQAISSASHALVNPELMAVLSSKYKITPQIIWNLFDQLQNEFLVAMPIDQYTADKKKELAQILLSESKPILFLAEDSFFLIRQSGSSTEIPTQSQAENYEFERAQSDLANCLDNITAEKRKFFTSFKYALELAKTLNPTLTKGDIPDVVKS